MKKGILFFLLTSILFTPIVWGADAQHLAGIHWWGNVNDNSAAEVLDVPPVGTGTGWDLEVVVTHDGWTASNLLPLYREIVPNRGMTVITRIDYLWSATVPAATDPNYSSWANTVVGVVNELKDYCHLWLIGNEGNLYYDNTSQYYTDKKVQPQHYATVYRAVRNAIRNNAQPSPLGPHKVLIMPVSPGGVTGFTGGMRWMDGAQYLGAVLDALSPGEVDGFGLHAYSAPDGSVSDFRQGYEHQLTVIDSKGYNNKPAYITEWNQGVDTNNALASEPQAAQFVRDAYKDVDTWNKTTGKHPIVGLMWFVFASMGWDSMALLYWRDNGATGTGDLFTAYKETAKLRYPAGNDFSSVRDTTAPSVPTLSSPAAGTTISSIPITFSWSTATDSESPPVRYDFQVDNNSSFASPEVNQTGLIATSYQVTTLTNGTYYWHVRAVDSASTANTSAWSTSRSFTLSINDTTPPAVPSLTAPTNGTSTTNTKPTFQWSTVTDPMGVTYSLQVDDDSGFGSPVINQTGLTSTTYTPTTALGVNITYYWRVQAVDGLSNKSAWTSAWNFQVTINSADTIQSTPGTPTIDGNFSEWSTAGRVSIGNFSGQDNSVDVYSMWDTNNVYFAFNVRDSEMWTVATTRDGAVWQDDCAEVFLDTNNDAASQPQTDDYQVLVNLNNIVSDLKGTGTSRDSSWNSTWTSAVKYTGTLNNNGDSDTGYVVEVSIPFTTLGKTTPANGTVWGCMFQVDDSEASGNRRTTVNWPTGALPDVPSGWKKILFSGTTPTGDTTAPAVPTLSSPADASTQTTGTPTFTWSAVTDAQSSPVIYEIQVANNSTFNSPGINETNVTSNQYTPSTSLSNGTYYWRVLAKDSASTPNKSAWSSTRSVVITVSQPTTDTTPPAVPSLSSPADASTQTTGTPTFTWTAVTDSQSPPVSYEIQVANNNSFNSTTINQTGLSSTQFTPSATLTNGTYYWRVLASDNASTPNKSAWSSTRSVVITVSQPTTDTTPPAVPSLSSPADASTQTTGTPTFTWTAVTDSQSPPVSYEIQVANNSSFNSTTINQTGLSSTQFTPSATLTNGTYYWRVLASDNASTPNKSAWSSTRSVVITASQPTTDTTPPAVPNLTAPADGSTQTTGTPTFTWSAVTDSQSPPVSYEIQVANNSSFNSTAINQTGLSSTQFTPSATLTNGTYYWRVLASDNASTPNKSAWSSTRSVVITVSQPTTDTTPPAVPTLSSPTDGSTQTTGTPTFTWSAVTDSQSPPVSYEIQVANNSSFNSTTINQTGLSSTQFTPSATLTNGTYYWRIRAQDNATTTNKSSWSSGLSFQINLGGEGNNNKLKVDRGEVKSVALSPSVPGVISAKNNEKVRFVFKSTELNSGIAIDYKLTVLDLAGNIIHEDFKTSNLDQDSFTWSPETNLPPGVYIGYIEGPGLKQYDTFIVAK